VGVVVEHDRAGRREVLLLVDLDESTGSVGVGEDRVDGPTLSRWHRFRQVATGERRVDLPHERPLRAAVVSAGSEQPSGSRTGCELTVGYLREERDAAPLDLQCHTGSRPRRCAIHSATSGRRSRLTWGGADDVASRIVWWRVGSDTTAENAAQWESTRGST